MPKRALIVEFSQSLNSGTELRAPINKQKDLEKDPGGNSNQQPSSGHDFCKILTQPIKLQSKNVIKWDDRFFFKSLKNAVS